MGCKLLDFFLCKWYSLPHRESCPSGLRSQSWKLVMRKRTVSSNLTLSANPSAQVGGWIFHKGGKVRWQFGWMKIRKWSGRSGRAWKKQGDTVPADWSVPRIISASARNSVTRSRIPAIKGTAIACFIIRIENDLRQHRLGGSCGLRRIFCTNRAVWKMGNTSSIPAYSILSLGSKYLAETHCPIMRWCPKKTAVNFTFDKTKFIWNNNEGSDHPTLFPVRKEWGFPPFASEPILKAVVSNKLPLLNCTRFLGQNPCIMEAETRTGG